MRRDGHGKPGIFFCEDPFNQPLGRSLVGSLHVCIYISLVERLAMRIWIEGNGTFQRSISLLFASMIILI